MQDEDKPPKQDNEDEDDYCERIWQWEADVRKAVQPEPGTFEPPKTPKKSVDLVRDYAQRGLQVIAK